MSSHRRDKRFAQYSHLPPEERLEAYIELSPPELSEQLKKLYDVVDDNLVDRAARIGDFELTMWLLRQGERATPKAMVYAVDHNNIEMANFIGAFGVPYQQAVRAAIEQGKIKIVEQLAREYRYTFSSKDLDAAAVSGQIKSLEWLKKNTNYMPSPNGVDEAVSTGNLKVLNWLYDHYPESGYTANGLINAVASNQYKALVWLIEHKDFFLANGMYWARSNIDFLKDRLSQKESELDTELNECGDPNENLLKWSCVWIKSLRDPRAALEKCYQYRDSQYRMALESALDEAEILDRDDEMVELIHEHLE